MGAIGRKGEITGAVGLHGQGHGTEPASFRVEDAGVNPLALSGAGVYAKIEALLRGMGREGEQQEGEEEGYSWNL